MENLLLNAWSTVGSVVLAILILLVMITIHEFGHYIAGKLLGFRIDEFSIGFGPALFKRRSKKTGELFALRLIPLGGYCAFAGEDGLDDETDAKQEEGEEGDPKKNGDGKKQSASEPFPQFQEDGAQPKPSDADHASAANVPSADGALEAHKRDESVAQPSVQTCVGGASEEGNLSEKDKEAPVRTGGEFTKMAPWKRIIVLIAGAFMNYVLAVFLLIVCFFAYGQTMIAVYKAEPTAEIPAQ